MLATNSKRSALVVKKPARAYLAKNSTLKVVKLKIKPKKDINFPNYLASLTFWLPIAKPIRAYPAMLNPKGKAEKRPRTFKIMADAAVACTEI